MSTSLLYHAFGIRGYHYQSSEYQDGVVTFAITQNRDKYRCSACGSDNVEARGKRERIFQSLPIGGKATYIRFDVPRVHCRACGLFRQVTIGFADSMRRQTRAFERYAWELSRLTTIDDAAKHLGVTWECVKKIQQAQLASRYAKPRLKDLRLMAIDEISVGRGHRYVTLVMDLESGAVVFVGRGKDAAALKPFWRSLKASHAEIEAVAMDMSKAYILAVRQNLPEAALVFDRFHVMKLMNDKLSDLRRMMYRELSAGPERQVLKGTRWLLLKNPENLCDHRDERRRLEKALQLNQPLATAYYLKEDLGEFWEQPSKKAAHVFLQSWIRRAESSGIKQLQQMAGTLGAYRSGLLAYYDYPITTGPLEGTNNKIKTMKRMAYGYRDTEFFELKIKALHEMKHALIG